MLALSPKTIKIKSTTILHLVHPKYSKDPEILSCINTSKCQSKQVAYPGNSMITQERIDSFESIIIHTVPPKDLSDWCSRVEKMMDRLTNTLESKERTLYFLGDSVRITCPQIFYIPDGPNTLMNDATTSEDIIRDIKGLDLVSVYFDLHSNVLLKHPRYLRNIQYASGKYSPMYGMPDASIIRDGKITGQRIVQITPTKVYQYNNKTIDLSVSLPAAKSPKPGKMKAFYRDDFDKDGFLKDQDLPEDENLVT